VKLIVGRVGVVVEMGFVWGGGREGDWVRLRESGAGAMSSSLLQQAAWKSVRIGEFGGSPP
jgi:hypothetical protein